MTTITYAPPPLGLDDVLSFTGRRRRRELVTAVAVSLAVQITWDRLTIRARDATIRELRDYIQATADDWTATVDAKVAEGVKVGVAAALREYFERNGAAVQHPQAADN